VPTECKSVNLYVKYEIFLNTFFSAFIFIILFTKYSYECIQHFSTFAIQCVTTKLQIYVYLKKNHQENDKVY